MSKKKINYELEFYKLSQKIEEQNKKIKIIAEKVQKCGIIIDEIKKDKKQDSKSIKEYIDEMNELKVQLSTIKSDEDEGEDISLLNGSL